MNCGVCARYLAGLYELPKQGVKITVCAGCRAGNRNCGKKSCSPRRKHELYFCFECGDFPCDTIKRLDKRYRTFYRTSEIKNLEIIRDHGITAFLKQEAEKWTCPDCGGVISCHNGVCFRCGVEKLKKKKPFYRW